MIGTCIAMAIWTSGLLYMTARTEKRRAVEAGGEVADKDFEAVGGDSKA
jgi:hypothetical protein